MKIPNGHFVYGSDNMFDPVTMDPQLKEPRASIEHFVMENEGQRLLGVLFKPAGRGPHPTAVVLHGFPGHDRNLDIAHMLRRGGWNALVFHYRGSWGSGGEFTFSNMLEDTIGVVRQLSERSAEYQVDTERMMLLGHSMGGWAAVMAASGLDSIGYLVHLAGFDLGGLGVLIDRDDEVRKMARRSFEELSVPLNVLDVDLLLNEVVDNRNEWSVPKRGKDLADRKLLLVSASNDTLSIPDLHFEPFRRSLLDSGARDLTARMLDSDHSFSDARIELQRTIWNWISSI